MTACACLAAVVAPPARAVEPADAPPRLVSAVVQKGPTKSRLTVAFAPVPSATGYNLQASRALTFTRLVVDATSEGSPFTDVVVAPGVYFVRLRALGPTGPGPFGPVEVVNALASGLQVLDRGSAPAGGAPGDPAATAGVTTAELPAASPSSGSATVAGLAPAAPRSSGSGPDAAIAPSTPSAPLPSSGAGPDAAIAPSTPGAPLPSSDAGPDPTIAPSTPSAPSPSSGIGPDAAIAPSTPGPASPSSGPAPDAATAIPPPISEQDLAALGPLRVRYEALRADLQQIESLRQALAASATTVLRQLAGTRDARESAELVNELSALQAARREIDAEIERNLLELGRILARTPARP